MKWRKEMPNNERRLIAKYLLILMLPISLPMIVLIFRSCKEEFRQVKHNIVIEKQTEVTRRKIDGNYGYIRGLIYIGGDSVINMSATLIGDLKHPESWERIYGPNIFRREPWRYRLGDLSFPYELSKKANNDTIVVHKDGHEFRFLLYKDE